MEKRIKKFLEFNGKTIYFLAVDGTYWIAIKPICEAIGVNYERQRQNLKGHPIYRELPAIQQVVAADNKARRMLCLKERYIYGWLLNIRSDNPDLIHYQRECHDVLWEHFRGIITKQELQLKRKYLAEERIRELETILAVSNDDYNELKTMKLVVSQANSELRRQTKEIVENQTELWESSKGFDPLTGETENQEEE